MHNSILRTLAYADIFDYPLTHRELHHWSVSTPPHVIPARPEQSRRVKARQSSLTRRSSLIRNLYLTLPGRDHIISLRKSRHKWSQPKLQIAKRVGKWLSYIPWIKLVAITGALAMNNSDENDDIDLMIITSSNRLWLTRLLVIPLLEILGIRRRPLHSSFLILNSNNKICLNLWLDETALSVPANQRNLYTAHEVAQIKPIVNKDHTYQKFLSANSWLNSYLPNIRIPNIFTPLRSFTGPNSPNSPNFPNLFNSLAFKLQYWYMRRRMTRERVSPHFAFFHPRDTGKWVMQEYNKRLKKLTLSV